MDLKRPSSWVRLLARSRPALSALAVLVAAAIAGHADCADVVIGYSGETDYVPHAAEVK